MKPKHHERSETARENGRGGAGKTQRHENRQEPMKDHVPGHLGYDRSNLVGVTATTGKSRAESRVVSGADAAPRKTTKARTTMKSSARTADAKENNLEKQTTTRSTRGSSVGMTGARGTARAKGASVSGTRSSRKATAATSPRSGMKASGVVSKAKKAVKSVAAGAKKAAGRITKGATASRSTGSRSMSSRRSSLH